jgi:choline-sulfatase
MDHVFEVAGKQLAMKNYCDYCAHLDRKGVLQAYRDHVASRGPNSRDPETTRWTGAPWPFAEEDYVDIVTGNKICEAIDERPADQPFFVFGSFCGPHKPYDPPASYIDRFPAEPEVDYIAGDTQMSAATRERLIGVRRAYKAMIAVIDDQIGRILDKLEEDGLADSTVILFTCDHGEMLGDRNRMSKGQPWEQSAVVPTAIRHPDCPAGTRCATPVELTDLTATMLDIAGVDPQEALSKPWPGFHATVPCRSLMPIVRGEAERIRDVAFSECGGDWQMLKGDRWKYVRYLNTEIDGAPCEELYDLATDPNELNNRIADPDCAEIAGALRERRCRIIDATPAAQTGWAPYGPRPASA